MAEQQKEENQKTVVSFVVGLLIGGLLVWAFSGKTNDTVKPVNTITPTNNEASTTTGSQSTETTKPTTDVKTTTPTGTPAASLPIGEGKVSVGTDVKAGMSVPLDSATFPTKEGWVGVRDYTDGKLGGLLGVARFSSEQGLVPNAITLQRATVAGKQYAIVFYSESGDRKFNLANDIQNGNEFATFTAK